MSTRGLGPFDTFMVEPLRMCTVTVTPRQPTRTTGDVASPSHQRQLDRDEWRFESLQRDGLLHNVGPHGGLNAVPDP